MKQVWMGIAVCLCLSCTQMRGGQEGVVLDLTEKGTDTLGFGDVFDVVGVVPLETKNECLLGHVSKVEVVDGNYYVLDGQRKVVFVFDGQGAFLRRIGIMGHGHGEYERASDFTVDRDRRRVVILCGPREVYMYDLQGQFVGKKDVGPWWVWKIASCPEGFVGSTEDATYSEGEMAYLFYAFDPDFMYGASGSECVGTMPCRWPIRPCKRPAARCSASTARGMPSTCGTDRPTA